MNDDVLISLVISAAYIVVGAAILYFVVRGAVISALRAHAFWRADGTYEIELARHRRDNSL